MTKELKAQENRCRYLAEKLGFDVVKRNGGEWLVLQGRTVIELGLSLTELERFLTTQRDAARSLSNELLERIR